MQGVDYKKLEKPGGAEGIECSTQSSGSCYCTWAGACESTLAAATAGAALLMLLQPWGCSH